VDKHIQEEQQQQKEDSGFTVVVSLDKSFFFYDSLVRWVVWIEKKRPIVIVTGSKLSCIFGALSREDKQFFRKYDIFNGGDTFLEFLKIIHDKFPRCYLFIDKAYYKCKKVRAYFDNHKNTLIPVYLPTTASSEFMVMEEIWNIAKRYLLVLKDYPSFADFKDKISRYFQNKKIQSSYGELFVTKWNLENIC
jgi:hypothetical protein